MHLIFLATLLVSTLSPWLHPVLASFGTYAALARCLFHHFHALDFFILRHVCLKYNRIQEEL